MQTVRAQRTGRLLRGTGLVWAALALGLLQASIGSARSLTTPDPVVDDGKVPPQAEGIRIEDKAGAQIPKGLHFKDQNGQDVLLDSYFDGARPVVLVLAYFTCPMLCTVVLNGLTNGLKGVAWNAGEAYRVVTVSIDQRDTPELAKKKRANYVEEYGRTIKPDAWDFLTGDAQNVKQLADAIGFHYRWDPNQQQFAHAAGAFILTPTGKISRVFYGISFPAENLKLALMEASNGKYTTAVDQLLLLCFHYDPKAGKYVIAAQRLMTAGGVLTVLLMGFFVGRHFRNERRESKVRAAT